MRRLLPLALAIASASPHLGCGSTPPEGPASTIGRYADAISSGDSEASLILLDELTHPERDPQRQELLLADNRAELGREAEAMRRALPTARARAWVTLESGERVSLVLEREGWRVDGGVLDATGLATPLDAMSSLRRALLRRDLPGLERLMARETRSEWDDARRRLLDVTADHDDLEVEIQGDRARVRTSEGGSVELIREDGEWRVRDILDP